jgi:hypothetical protein
MIRRNGAVYARRRELAESSFVAYSFPSLYNTDETFLLRRLFVSRESVKSEMEGAAGLSDVWMLAGRAHKPNGIFKCFYGETRGMRIDGDDRGAGDWKSDMK